jgi:hypothetical protein
VAVLSAAVVSAAMDVLSPAASCSMVVSSNCVAVMSETVVSAAATSECPSGDSQ